MRFRGFFFSFFALCLFASFSSSLFFLPLLKQQKRYCCCLLACLSILPFYSLCCCHREQLYSDAYILHVHKNHAGWISLACLVLVIGIDQLEEQHRQLSWLVLCCCVNDHCKFLHHAWTAKQADWVAKNGGTEFVIPQKKCFRCPPYTSKSIQFGFQFRTSTRDRTLINFNS